MSLLEQHFDVAFAAPDGIKKLRELILTLAMQGKLVPQDPNDKPASELLKEIELEKKRLLKEGKIKQLKTLPEINSEYVPYELPDGWEWVSFGNIAQHNSGKTLDKGRNTGELRDYITTSNLYWGYFELARVRQMPIREEEIEKCSARKGDLLICEGGEAGRAAVWFYDKEICFQNHVHRARFYCDIYPYYAYHFFERLNATGEINQYRKGVGISNMSSKVLASILFPLPPLAEQRRIVAKIDQLMARCDELEKLRIDRSQRLLTVHTAALDRLLTAKDSSEFSTAWSFITQHFGELYSVKENVVELRKTILQLAVMGKLVPQELAPKIDSLQSILAESSINGVSKGPTCDTSATEVLRISAGTSQRDFYVNEDDFKHVDLSVNEIQKFQLLPGDLLACRFNGNLHYVGRFSYYRGESGRVQVNPDKLIRFRIDTDSYSPRYVCYMMNAAQTREAIEEMCATTAGNIGLSAGKLKTIKIPLPPLAEQGRIVEKIDRLMGMCDRLEESIASAKGKQTALLNALMSQV